MTTFTAFTTLAEEASAKALGLSMEALDPAPLGIGVFEIEDGSGRWEVAGYFSEKPDIAGLALLAAINGAGDFAVSRLDDRDWVAQVRRELSPVSAGRFLVHGSHDREAVPAHKIGLCIDAAMAFGTGHHGTTIGCLKAMETLALAGFRPERIADIGTGTGVLAMAAARLWPADIVASDMDPVATATARANIAANQLGPRIRVFHTTGLRGPLLTSAPYDLIVANILAGPLKRMAPDMLRVAAPGARIVLSGILNRQARGVEAVYQGLGAPKLAGRREGEWTTLTFRKRNVRPT